MGAAETDGDVMMPLNSQEGDPRHEIYGDCDGRRLQYVQLDRPGRETYMHSTSYFWGAPCTKSHELGVVSCLSSMTGPKSLTTER